MRPALGHDLRQAEGAADLDKLAAGDNDLFVAASPASTSIVAAALLFTTVAASAPVSSVRIYSTSSSRSIRSPVSRSTARVRVPLQLSRSSSPPRWPGKTARPRPVCRMMPVALMALSQVRGGRLRQQCGSMGEQGLGHHFRRPATGGAVCQGFFAHSGHCPAQAIGHQRLRSAPGPIGRRRELSTARVMEGSTLQRSLAWGPMP